MCFLNVMQVNDITCVNTSDLNGLNRPMHAHLMFGYIHTCVIVEMDMETYILACVTITQITFFETFSLQKIGLSKWSISRRDRALH